MHQPWISSLPYDNLTLIWSFFLPSELFSIQCEEEGAVLKPLTLNDRSGNSRIFHEEDSKQPVDLSNRAELQARGLLKRMSCFKHQTSEENPLILQQQQALLKQQQIPFNQRLIHNQNSDQVSSNEIYQNISNNNPVAAMRSPMSSNFYNNARAVSTSDII